MKTLHSVNSAPGSNQSTIVSSVKKAICLFLTWSVFAISFPVDLSASGDSARKIALASSNPLGSHDAVIPDEIVEDFLEAEANLSSNHGFSKSEKTVSVASNSEKSFLRKLSSSARKNWIHLAGGAVVMGLRFAVVYLSTAENESEIGMPPDFPPVPERDK